MRFTILAMCLMICACSGVPSATYKPSVKDTLGSPQSGDFASRPTVSRSGCNSEGGQEVGDIGDGRIHRSDYLCANGEPPIATIINSGQEQRAVEGAVCCRVTDR